MIEMESARLEFVPLVDLMERAGHDPSLMPAFQQQLMERQGEALVQIERYPELLMPLRYYGLIGDSDLETLLADGIRNANAHLITVMLRDVKWIDLRRFLTQYEKVAEMLLSVTPKDYRAPSILSVVDLLNEDWNFYQELTTLLTNKTLVPQFPVVRWNQDFDSLANVISHLDYVPNKRQKLQDLVFGLARCLATDLVIATGDTNTPLYLDIFSNPYGGAYADTIRKALETRDIPEGLMKKAITAILQDRILEARVRYALKYLD